jgi:hypothetical protein
MGNTLNLNGIINKCILNICVTGQVTNYKHPEEDTVVSKHVGGV